MGDSRSVEGFGLRAMLCMVYCACRLTIVIVVIEYFDLLILLGEVLRLMMSFSKSPKRVCAVVR